MIHFYLHYINCSMSMIGYSEAEYVLFEKKENVHDAASYIWNVIHAYSNSRRSGFRKFIACEFHDDNTHKTWHTDSGGHTQKDYRFEYKQEFEQRWAWATVNEETSHGYYIKGKSERW